MNIYLLFQPGFGVQNSEFPGKVTEINEVKGGHRTYTHRHRGSFFDDAATIFYNQMPYKNRQG